MSVLDGIHRKEKPEIENIKDHYKTSPAITLALIDKYIRNMYPKNIRVVDGCSGEKHIAKVLRSYFDNVEDFDLYMGENRKDFLEVPILENGYQWVIMMRTF